ncbi:hypothetical protein E2C01_099177 [Portunus trituberculatus]|uniref:Uncharacterized protein n=1 Tax=Portunus trituberculatus TaxID=210409 RepID=A0A5B7K9N0_PORTR|nr:hypothetical protein [Portunus trituberculatus]
MSLWQWDTKNQEEALPTKNCSPSYDKIIADMIEDCFKTANNQHSQHTKKKRHQRR